MNDHAYLKRMQKEYGAVIEGFHRRIAGGWEIVSRETFICENYNNFYSHSRICPIWLEDRLKNTIPDPRCMPPVEEHEFKTKLPRLSRITRLITKLGCYPAHTTHRQ